MPSPSVGYSRVVVENIQKGTGYTEHEFYTAKDFPVLIREPHLIKEPPKKNHLARLFKFNVEDNMTVSQSYAIELNDMHGKQKATRIYSNEADEQGNPVAISKVEYFYKTEPNNISRLSNKITVIDKEGKIRRDALAGITIDMTIDERESKSVTSSFGVKGNFDLSSIIPPVVVIPTISAFPSASKESTRFRSITNTKVITRYGILDRVEAEDLGAKITTKNLAWDAETGEVLLTRVENDFKDPVYSFTYPAHWGYDGMSSAYKNIGVHSNFIENGILPGADNHFTPGDEVLVMPYIKVTIADKEYAAPMRDEAKKGWITEITGNNITVLDRDGEEIEDYPMKITVLRSGRRNISTTPIGTVVTLQNPLQGDAIEFKEVLQSSAIEFASDWNGFCETCQKKNNNPYITGKKGIFRPKKSYAYLTGRTQSDYNRNTNMRKDGTFTAFSPFWRPNSGNDWLVNTANWTFTSEVTLFSPYGFELENMDALKRYTAALYGYNNTIPTAVAGNARYKEMGFTGFEDAGMQCPESEHFSFPKTTDVIFTEDQSHTGRFSIQVPPAKRVSMEKVLKECK